jgi:hypothetical protein
MVVVVGFSLVAITAAVTRRKSASSG